MSKPCHPHHKDTYRIVYKTGYAPHILPVPVFKHTISLWWRCRESNPGPQCLHYEGITTILYLRFFNVLRAVALTDRE